MARRGIRWALVVSTVLATTAALAPAATAQVAGTGVVTGWITDGAGVVGAIVKAYRPSGAVAAHTTTDSRGNFAFSALRRGSYRICVDGAALHNPRAPLGYVFGCWRYGDGLADAEPVVVQPGAPQNVTISASAAAVLSGTVRDTAGNPLAAAPIVVDDLPVATTDADGQWTARIRATNVTVCAHGATVDGPTSQVGYLTACYRGGQSFTASRTARTKGVDMTLSPASAVSGRVVDQSGRPLAHVHVGVQTFGTVPTDTDADGRYTVRGIDPQFRADVEFDTADATGGGSPTGYVDRCYGHGTSCSAVTFVTGTTTSGIDATVQWAGGLSGRVADRNGVAVSGEWVLVGGYDVARSGADGSWSAPRVTPGPVTVCFRDIGSVTGADADGYQDQCWHNRGLGDATTIHVTAGVVSTGIDATLVGNGGVAGRVVDATGAPVSSAIVTWHSDDAGTNSTRTASDGTYRVGRLEVGTYSVCLDEDGTTSPAGLAPVCTSTPVQVTDNRTADGGTIVMPKAASISGTVADDSGALLAGVEVTAYDADHGTTVRADTNTSGTYTIGDLAPGSYTVCFDPRFAFPRATDRARAEQCWDDAEGTAAPTVITLTAGATTTGIDATIHPTTEVTGTVTDRNGTTLTNVWIELDGAQVTSTGPTGTFTIDDVTPGVHTLCFRGGGAFPASGSSNGYSDSCWKNRTPDQRPTPLDVPAHQQVIADARLTALPHG